ncbi:hypothetical protein B0H11DRAFT_2069900, partial [Mycena galericulata]
TSKLLLLFTIRTLVLRLMQLDHAFFQKKNSLWSMWHVIPSVSPPPICVGGQTKAKSDFGMVSAAGIAERVPPEAR